MKVIDLLTPERVFWRLNCQSKKKCLESIANLLSEQVTNLDSGDVFNALIAREKLGSTGLGHGVAIPHCHLPDLDQAYAMLITLESPIDFDAIDNRPIDILFALIVPDGQEQHHLDLLASIVETMGQQTIRETLRKSPDQLSLYKAFCSTGK